jgi:hypothetical protein
VLSVVLATVNPDFLKEMWIETNKKMLTPLALAAKVAGKDFFEVLSRSRVMQVEWEWGCIRSEIYDLDEIDPLINSWGRIHGSRAGRKAAIDSIHKDERQKWGEGRNEQQEAILNQVGLTGKGGAPAEQRIIVQGSPSNPENKIDDFNFNGENVNINGGLLSLAHNSNGINISNANALSVYNSDANACQNRIGSDSELIWNSPLAVILRYRRTDLLSSSSVFGMMLAQKQKTYALECYTITLIYEVVYVIILTFTTIFYFGTSGFFDASTEESVSSSSSGNTNSNTVTNSASTATTTDSDTDTSIDVFKIVFMIIGGFLLARKMIMEFVEIRAFPYITGICKTIKLVRFVHFFFVTAGILLYNLTGLQDQTDVHLEGKKDSLNPLYHCFVACAMFTVLTAYLEMIMFLTFTSSLGCFVIIITRMIRKDLTKMVLM